MLRCRGVLACDDCPKQLPGTDTVSLSSVQGLENAVDAYAGLFCEQECSVEECGLTADGRRLAGQESARTVYSGSSCRYCNP